jgi:hypothetical protein
MEVDHPLLFESGVTVITHDKPPIQVGMPEPNFKARLTIFEVEYGGKPMPHFFAALRAIPEIDDPAVHDVE